MFNSIGLIGIAIILALIGIPLATAIYGGFVLGFAGMPGAFLTEVLSRNAEKSKIPILGFLLTVAGQTYASLAFVVFIVLSVYSWTNETAGIGKWLLWIIAFFVAIAPALKAARTSASEMDKDREDLSVGAVVPYYAMMITMLLTIIGFFIFAFFPSLTLWGWGWIPHF